MVLQARWPPKIVSVNVRFYCTVAIVDIVLSDKMTSLFDPLHNSLISNFKTYFTFNSGKESVQLQFILSSATFQFTTTPFSSVAGNRYPQANRYPSLTLIQWHLKIIALKSCVFVEEYFLIFYIWC